MRHRKNVKENWGTRLPGDETACAKVLWDPQTMYLMEVPVTGVKVEANFPFQN